MKSTITTFKHSEIAILDSFVLLIASFRRRGLLSGTLSDILATTSAHPQRRIVPNISDEATPVLLHLTSDATYNNSDLKAASSDNIFHAMDSVARCAGVLYNIGGCASRRGAAYDANDLEKTEWKAGVGAQVGIALGHSKITTTRGITAACADARTQNLSTAHESKLPPTTSTSDLLQYPSTLINDLRVPQYEHTEQSQPTVVSPEASTQAISESIASSGLDTVSDATHDTIEQMVQIEELSQPGPCGIFAWSSTELCNFLSAYNVLKAPSEMRHGNGHHQTADSL